VNGGGRGSYYLPLKATDKIDDTLIGSFMQLLQDNAGDQIKKKIEGNKTSRALPSSSSFFFCIATTFFMFFIFLLAGS
jgi:hypothetical protein